MLPGRSRDARDRVVLRCFLQLLFSLDVRLDLVQLLFLWDAARARRINLEGPPLVDLVPPVVVRIMIAQFDLLGIRLWSTDLTRIFAQYFRVLDDVLIVPVIQLDPGNGCVVARCNIPWRLFTDLFLDQRLL